jgi:hypothetical protein
MNSIKGFDIYKKEENRESLIYYLELQNGKYFLVNKLSTYYLEKEYTFEAKVSKEITPSNNYPKDLVIPILRYNAHKRGNVCIGYKSITINEIFKMYGNVRHTNCNCSYCLTERYILSNME